VLCEGYSRDQAFDALSDHYRSRTQLWTVLTGYIIPTLKELLHDYERKRSISTFVRQRDAVLYRIVELKFHETGYDLTLVNTKLDDTYGAEQDRQLLERSFRDQEFETRLDAQRIETAWPLSSKLTKLGNRNRTRLFAVRKAN
jgi:hypothetical protein